MVPMIRVVAVVMVLGGCSGGGTGDKGIGGQPDGAVGAPSDAAGPGVDGAAPDGASPDAAPPEVPFEDRAWHPLEEIGAGRYPEVVIDGQGNAMTTWEVTGVEGCVTRRKPLDAAWEPDVALVTPQSVEDELDVPGTTVVADHDNCAGTDGGAGLAMDASGSAIALFTHTRFLRDDATGDTTLLHAGMRSLYDPATGWSEGELSGPRGTYSPYVAVAMNESGGGLMAWAQGGEVWAARYQPGAGWQAAVQLDASFCCVRVVLDGAGNGLAVWNTGLSSELHGARLADGAWSSANRVDDALGVEGPPEWDIGMNEAGAALLVWHECDEPSVCVMRARRFDPAGGWSTSDVIGDGGEGYDGRMVDVALDPDGNAIAVWSTGPRHSQVGVVPRVEAARFRDGVWMAAETLAVGEAGSRALDPNVVLDRYGEGLVGWRFQWEVGDNPYRSEIMARTYTPEGGFGPIESLDAADEYSSRLELAMNAVGIGIAVWNISSVARARLFR